MCRIYGYFNADVSPTEFRTVAALQRHGGPDGHGHSRRAGCGIGNNRLAIVDLDGGQQPYRLGDDIQVVFNGEIYNHRELRESLHHKGYRFDDHCDGNVLPALYAEYGDGFTAHLDGMYAVAVLDLRAHPRLLLATDHAGMKPLYYRTDPVTRSLRFSSELPAMLAFEGADTAAWLPGLDAYLAGKTPFGERTMFDDVRVLPPSSTMTVTAGAEPVLVRRDPTEGARTVPASEDGGTLRELLDLEVNRLLDADVPAAVITSGGLDSSLVTALAARKLGPLHSFTVAYTGTWPSDERGYAAEVAARAGTRHHLVEVDPASFPDLLEDVVWHLGQPNADPITISTWALFREVSRSGFKVALSGDAADEVFGGYGRMRAAVEADRAGRPWLPGYLDSLGVLPASTRHGLYTGEYRSLLGATEALPEGPVDRLADGPGSTLDRITEFELGVRLPAYHLRRVDHLSMAHSVEVRLPFCQRDVMALGRALPDHRRISDGKVKRALYAAAGPHLPESVLNRPKQPFTLPITEMLRPGQPLWDLARDMLASGSLRRGGQLDPAAVQAVLETQSTAPDDTAALTIWALLVHETWSQQFRAGVRLGALTGVAA